MFKTIVVGVDGREGGRDALALAGRLALLAGGELVAVRALPFDIYVARRAARSTTRSPSRREAPARRGLSRRRSHGPHAPRPDASPARALHRVAEAERADVIVVGSTRHGAFGRVFTGDDAAAALHGSTCPVAVAPRGLADQEWKPVQRIGVGFNAGPEAQQALALAAALAADCGASLAVQTVVAAPIAYADFAAYDSDWLGRSKELAKEQRGRGGRATSRSRRPVPSPSARRWTSSSSSPPRSTSSCSAPGRGARCAARSSAAPPRTSCASRTARCSSSRVARPPVSPASGTPSRPRRPRPPSPHGDIPAPGAAFLAAPGASRITLAPRPAPTGAQRRP